jgi:ABC-type multidrug transport system fused ATPase/permease subunit
MNAYVSTVKAADRIIVLETIRIIEEGDHAGLLAGGGHNKFIRTYAK